jgi:hypothetical protein
MPKNEPEIGNLYYITHIENVQSIMTHRILAHAAIEERGIDYVPVYDAGIVADRQSRATSSGRSLWDYANLYFQPRNPMLYRVLHEKGAADVAILAIQKRVLELPGPRV